MSRGPAAAAWEAKVATAIHKGSRGSVISEGDGEVVHEGSRRKRRSDTRVEELEEEGGGGMGRETAPANSR